MSKKGGGMKNKDKQELEKNLNNEISKIKSDSLRIKLLKLYSITKNKEKLDKDLKRELAFKHKEFLSKSIPIFEESSKIIKGEKNIISLIKETFIEKYPITKEELTINKGLSLFWFNVIKNSRYFEINSMDEQILPSLIDIKISLIGHTVILKYIFAPNEFMNDSEIWKEYHYNQYKELKKINASEINWTNDDKNPTKIKKNDSFWFYHNSFFNIFKKNQSLTLNQRITEEYQANVIIDILIPNSFKYFKKIEYDENEDTSLDEYFLENNVV